MILGGGAQPGVGRLRRDQGTGRPRWRRAVTAAAPAPAPAGRACAPTAASPSAAARICSASQTTCTQGACTQHACANGAKTTVSGTIYDPAARNPLYNIIVYVPNASLAPITEGVGCERCDGTATGSPIASALTDATGHFVLDNAPVGSSIPLVIQIGKWRRQVSIPSVTACQDTPIPDPDHNLLRLPRDQTEGHIPRIALATGHSDALDCLLRKIGIADSEFTNGDGSGRVNMFVGGDGGSGTGANKLASGAVFSDAYTTLYASYDKLAQYDLLILQCEGSQLESMKLPYVANIRRYADNGGRIFDEHLHSYWIRKGLPPWPGTAAWLQSIDSGAVTTLTATINTSFAKGAALADWLQSLQATTTRGQIDLTATEHSVDAVMGGDAELDLHQRFSHPVSDLQHADRGAGGRSVRSRGVHRPARRIGRRRLALRHAVPDRLLHDADDVAAGAGAGVHALRPVVVRAAGECSAGADPDSVVVQLRLAERAVHSVTLEQRVVGSDRYRTGDGTTTCRCARPPRVAGGRATARRLLSGRACNRVGVVGARSPFGFPRLFVARSPAPWG